MLTQQEQGPNDHASCRASTPHLTVEYEGSVWRLVPDAPLQHHKVPLFGRLLIRHRDPQVLKAVALLCSSTIHSEHIKSLHSLN